MSSALLVDVYNVPVPTKDAVEAQTRDDETNENISQCHHRFDRSKRAVYEDYVIFTISGRCVFSRGIATNQKQTQQEDKSMTRLWLQYNILKNFIQAEQTEH